MLILVAPFLIVGWAIPVVMTSYLAHISEMVYELAILASYAFPLLINAYPTAECLTLESGDHIVNDRLSRKMKNQQSVRQKTNDSYGEGRPLLLHPKSWLLRPCQQLLRTRKRVLRSSKQLLRL